MLIPSFPGIASLTSRGLVSTDSQPFRGQKSFMGPLTAGASDKALVAGTDVPDGSVNGGFRMLSLVTGFGGTEKEYVRVSRPTAYDQPVMTIDQNAVTNTRGLLINNTPAGVGGLKIVNYGGGTIEMNAQQPGEPSRLHAENKGLHLYQNANSYNSSMLMRFEVATPTGVAASIPVFDFQSAALGASQKLARFKDNVGDLITVNRDSGYAGVTLGGYSQIYATGSWTQFTDVARFSTYAMAQGTTTAFYASGNGAFAALGTARMWSESLGGASGDVLTRLGGVISDASMNAGGRLLVLSNNMAGTPVDKVYFRKSGGMVIGADTANPVCVGAAADLANVADGFKYNVGASELGIFSSNNSAFLGINLGTGNARCSGSFFLNGEVESTLTGAGVVLKSPDGTRWRLTITNAGAVAVAAA